MNESLNPSQLTTLCVVFVAFHLLALPAFYWALRQKQFSGAHQREWSLESSEAAFSDSSKPISARKARVMMAVLMTFGVLTLSSIVLTLIVALYAPAHAAATGGKCPF